ncbi:hypothetical protein [Pseudoxanthomonas sp. GM95]|uniref:hypothetical protein n=1 Tax=Pseudoxanthomonas sp. GM95 TaxID=1881043 RepID=UPI001587DAA6|nr:hypothetical protein [Pseudoxanthomonas sp. GM95]
MRSIGVRPARSGFASFCRDKRKSRPSGVKAFDPACGFKLARQERNFRTTESAKLSRRFAARVTFVAAKVTKTASRRTLAAAARRCPALLEEDGTSPKLASLRQGDSAAVSFSDARLALRLRQGKQRAKTKQINDNGANSAGTVIRHDAGTPATTSLPPNA